VLTKSSPSMDCSVKCGQPDTLRVSRTIYPDCLVLRLTNSRWTAPQKQVSVAVMVAMLSVDLVRKIHGFLHDSQSRR
jgi:hypothetical protein